jgi:cyclophilin family peptidyl-prolyl cis-trans isomerase
MRSAFFLFLCFLLPVLTAQEQILAEMKTNYGTIKIALFPKKAPITVQNFLEYVAKGHYNGTIFHRVIDGFMIQTGGYTEKLEEKATGVNIKNESNNGLLNQRGTLAMARTSHPDSATSQFFINLVDNAYLDFPNMRGSGYAVFGCVIEGMEICEKIAKVKVGAVQMMENVPLKPVIIEKVSLLQ